MTERPSDLPEPTSDDASAAQDRPMRPPVQQTTAEVVAATRPGRIQLVAERIWTTAILLAAIGLLTGWLTHGPAVNELLSQVPADGSETERREAAELLHTLALAAAALGILLESILVAFLRRRLVILRVLLTLLALVAAVFLSLILGIAVVPGWRGVLIAATLALHGLLAIVGSVLMWLPAGHPRAT